MISEEPKARGYKDLIVWQKAMRLVREIYVLTRSFPGDERFGLVSQMRRAAVSIPSILPRVRHVTPLVFIQFVSHAEGSVAELDTQLMIAVDLGYCDEETSKPLFDLLRELRKMLNGLRRKLQGR